VTALVDTLGERRLDLLSRIEQRVLWLAVRIVDYANRERPNEDELKVGGHQASSASMVSLMTALYIADLESTDRVSVKPHASPVLHAIEYLLGGSYTDVRGNQRIFELVQKIEVTGCPPIWTLLREPR